MSPQHRPMSSGESPSNARTFWDWFLLGAGAGVVYHAARNPGSCACCAGCLVLIALLVILAVIMIVLDHLLIVSLAVVGVAAWYYGWPRLRARLDS